MAGSHTDKLTIATYNCKYFDEASGGHKMNFMNDIFSQCDFICLQEHWLLDTQFHRFEKLCCEDVDYVATSAMDSTVFRSGRPHGGTAIVWRKSIKYNVTYIKTYSKRISAVKIQLNDSASLLLFTVYMPVDERMDGANLVIFQDVLSEISSIRQTEMSSNIIIIGDVNTDFGRLSPQTSELRSFCNSEGLYVCTDSLGNGVEYTFENSNGNRSKIDHCIVSRSLVETENSCSLRTFDSIDNASDHICVIARFDIDCEYIASMPSVRTDSVSWYKATVNDIDKYRQVMDDIIDSITVPENALNCRDVFCKKHKREIERFHDLLIHEVCIGASKRVLPSTSNKASRKKVIPGWSEYVAHKKQHALACHWAWKNAGRPNSGELFEERKRSRIDYHYAMRKVKENEKVVRSERMAQAISANDHKSLWSEVRSMKGKKTSLPAVVDNVRGENNIADLFADKYEKLYTSVKYSEHEMNCIYEDVNELLSKCHNQESNLFHADEFIRMLKNLAPKKSDGQVGLFSDHIINGSKRFHVLIVRLFNAMMIHGIVPEDMRNSVMLPIVKDKRLSHNDSNNFRAVCLQSALCKLLDLLILDKEKHCLFSSNLQFGFKAEHSSSLATSVLLEVVDYYLDNSGVVYCMALDASKAFDRVEFGRLFTLLLKRGINPLFIRILCEMYTAQKVCVRYNSCVSKWFQPINGVKQGGVLSPTLFSIYVNGMIEELVKAKIGCHVGNKYYGVIGYADDIMLIAPSQLAMNKMISICENYAESFQILFNGKKSKVIVFDKYATKINPSFSVNGQLVECVEELNYLGHVITSNRKDPLTGYVVKDFLRKFNGFIGDLNDVSSAVKGKLFKQYCTSLYGVVVCDVAYQNLDKLSIVWRKAIRRMFKLPPRTHNKLVPIISDILPVDLMVHLRTLSHICKGMMHKNSSVNFIFNMSLLNPSSVLGNNFKYICNKYKVFKSSQFVDMKKCIMKLYNNSIEEESIRTGKQIRQLIDIRDSLLYEDFDFSLCEIEEIIQFLCLS